MKKFTSLFALLSCLCVVSAQAEDVTVYVYGSYPDSQRFYWYDADETNDPTPAWDASSNIYPPKFTELDGSIEKDGDIFYKKILTPKNDETKIKIILSDPRLDDTSQAKQTDNIELTGGNTYYFYYFGDDNCYLSSPVSLTIAGSFNGWSTTSTSFVRNSMVNWTYDLDAPNGEVSFKLNLPENTYLGIGKVSLEAPQGWITGNDNDNFQLNTSTTGFTKYKLTATWNPSSNFSDENRWSLKIEGVELNLNDDIEFTCSNSYAVSKASYTRDFVNNWGTLCLPFAISTIPNGVTFYELSSVNASQNTLSFSSISSVAAGQPVVFKVGNGVALSISETNVNVSPSIAPVDGPSGWTLNGSFQEQRVTGTNLYYIAGNQFWYSGDYVDIPAYRAWFTGSLATPAPFRITADETEDIQFVEQEDGTVKAYFDLQGRKLDGARKGLVIENGKIIMVK